MNKNDSLTAALKFAPLLEKYFLTYLIAQKKSSPRTVSTYRDSFTLYLRFVTSVYGIAPDRIEMNHFSLDHLSAFGTYLETSRNCSPSTINLRMSAIKSLSLPARKANKQAMSFITKNEYESMLKVCNNPDAILSRYKMILMILYNTGCRVSELVNLCVSDISIETDGTSSIRFLGKGRKERITPIWKSTAAFIDNYIKQQNLNCDNHLLLNNRKRNLTRSGVGQRITTITEKLWNCPHR